ncbi:MAG: metallophosphoesterase family protein [Chloroflexi bacterium]|nr:metallophosphoesterase family protein [Chloroflexota bacterium]MBI3764043.1 metallophosphoesterase family protein [Chloroflexota bacterium]
MRVLIISDIHANLNALEAVLAATEKFDAAWCLGDLVGYGPDPNECVERVRSLPGLQCLVGNHDKAALGEIDLNAFNPDARAAVSWTQNALSPSTREYLQNLPEAIEMGKYTLVHGSPRQPVWEYILDARTALLCFPYFATSYCLIGHTHSPMIFSQEAEGGECKEKKPRNGERLILDNLRYIINSGSVGQPRDGNPEASYAVLDFGAAVWELRRVPYDVTATQLRMAGFDMPERLIARLTYGW